MIIKNKSKKGLIKYISLKTLIFLVLILLFNSFAWFIYATKVDSSIKVHVSSWNVSFAVGDDQSVTEFVLDVGKIYPGMPNYSQVINVVNNGETNAELTYQYKKITLFGQVYEIGNGYTQENLKKMMEEDNPFKVSVSVDSQELTATGNGTFTITVTWPFESGDDTTDTQWGERTYNYLQQNGQDANCLSIEFYLIAKQAN